MSENAPKHALVIGAGIIGICSTLALQDKGYRVTVIDRAGPGEATSFGNAGVISPWSCVPQSMPGVWKQVPQWLFDPDGPLAVRWSYVPQLLPWIIKFLNAGSEHRLPVIADAMLAVNQPSLDLYHQLLADTGEDNLVKDCCYLHVSRSVNGVDPQSLGWRMRKERGVPFEVLNPGEAQEIEPELSPEFKSAIVIKQQGRTINPGRLGQVLAAKAQAQGANFVRAEVKQIVPQASGGFRIDTSDEPYTAGIVILAGGAWSTRLLSPLGVHIPLEAERGYHLVYTDPGLTLSNSIMDVDHKFVTSSMEMGVRSAGTAEFAGLDAPPNYRRAQIFKRLSKELLPNLNTESNQQWMGPRPSSPDSVPYIGPVPGHPGLFCGFGHAHLGLTGAPMTGRMLAALVAEEPLNVDMTPYRVDRFND